MARELFELVGADDRRFSPYCWRTRMALAHKGLEARIVPCRFTEKHRIAFSGQERLPVLKDDDTVVSDSWRIACYLEDQYPACPSLFGGAIGRGEALFLNAWTDRELHLAILPLIVKDIHDHADPDDRSYFRTSREKALGATLEDIQAERDTRRKALDRTLAPIRAVLRAQPFLCGDEPAYGDYIVFGAFQWARGASPYPLLAADDPINGWRDRLSERFDGFARSVPIYD